MTQRLPNVGSDDGTWGTILNNYLLEAHNADGTIKNLGLANGVAPLDSTGKVPVANLPSSTTPDATTTSKGTVQLAGDLSGTAASPTVPALANKVSTSTTVNGKVLSSNISLQPSDLSLPNITVSTTAPSSPAIGDIWIDTT